MSRGGISAAGLEEALLGIRRRLPGQQMIEGCAERIDIGARVGVAGVAAVLLQRRVGHRAAALHDRHRAALVGLHQLDQAEIDQLDHAARGQLDVGGLDVAVQHLRILRVQIGERVAQLIDPADDGVLFEKRISPPRIFDELAQILPGHEVHHQIFAAVLLEEVGDFGQVGVIEPRQNAGFAVELLVRLIFRAGRADQLGQHFLDRADAAAQTQVVGFVDGAHAALSNQVGDVIAVAQDGADQKCLRHKRVV